MTERLKEKTTITLSGVIAVLGIIIAVFGRFDDGLEKSLANKLDKSIFDIEKKNIYDKISGLNNTLEKINIKLEQEVSFKRDISYSMKELNIFLKFAKKEIEEQGQEIKKQGEKIKKLEGKND